MKYFALYKCQYCDGTVEVETTGEVVKAGIGYAIQQPVKAPMPLIHDCYPNFKGIAVFVGYKQVPEEDEEETEDGENGNRDQGMV